MEKNEEKYLNLPIGKLKKATAHKGTHILYPNLELYLINFFEFNRKLFNSIIIWSSILKVLEYLPERKNKSIKTK